MLLLLNKDTFPAPAEMAADPAVRSRSEALAREVRHARLHGMQILLIHQEYEPPILKGASMAARSASSRGGVVDTGCVPLDVAANAAVELAATVEQKAAEASRILSSAAESVGHTVGQISEQIGESIIHSFSPRHASRDMAASSSDARGVRAHISSQLLMAPLVRSPN